LPEDIFLTIEEAADLEGVKYNTLLHRILRNPEDFNTKSIMAKSGGKERVLVGLSSLSPKAQKAYAKSQTDGIIKEMIEDKTSGSVPWYMEVDLNWYIENNKQQFYEAVELCNRIGEFIMYRGNNKTEFAENLANSLGISQRSLYDYCKKYAEANAWAEKQAMKDGQSHDYFKVLALCRKPSQRYKFPSLTLEMRSFINNLWYDREFAQNQGTVEMAYTRLEKQAAAYSWGIPSYSTVARYIQFEMNVNMGEPVRYYQANGERGFKRDRMVKASRNTKALPVMGLIQGDGHTFDCWVKYTHPNGKVSAIKPVLVGFVDTRTRVLVGRRICHHSNAQVIRQTLIDMIYTYGVPEYILIDNGKDFTAKQMTGRNRKDRISFDSETIGFYKSIGIKDDTRSLPYQPWSKAQVERLFGTICSKFTKWLSSYTGTLTGRRTAAKINKDIPKLLEKDQLLSMEEFAALFDKWVKEEYHQDEHKGLKNMKEAYGKPIELFEKAEEKYIKAPPPRSYAAMLMMKAERVHVYNIGIRKFGYEYRAPELCDYIDKKVDIKWDESDITRLYVYTPEGQKICEAESQELLLIAPKVPQKALEEHMKMQKQQLKNIRARANEYTTPLEELAENYNGHKSTFGFTIGNEPAKNDKLITLPTDKQFRDDTMEKKARKLRKENGYFKEQAEEALQKLRNLS